MERIYFLRKNDHFFPQRNNLYKLESKLIKTSSFLQTFGQGVKNYNYKHEPYFEKIWAKKGVF